MNMCNPTAYYGPVRTCDVNHSGARAVRLMVLFCDIMHCFLMQAVAPISAFVWLHTRVSWFVSRVQQEYRIALISVQKHIRVSTDVKLSVNFLAWYFYIYNVCMHMNLGKEIRGKMVPEKWSLLEILLNS